MYMTSSDNKSGMERYAADIAAYCERRNEEWLAAAPKPERSMLARMRLWLTNLLRFRR